MNTKRLGRYDHHLSINNNNDIFGSPSYFNEIASFHKHNGRKPSLYLNNPFFGQKHPSLEKVFSNAKKLIEKSTKLINKIESINLASANTAKAVPENATIRKEYIKCGKQICELKHGPLLLRLLERS